MTVPSAADIARGILDAVESIREDTGFEVNCISLPESLVRQLGLEDVAEPMTEFVTAVDGPLESWRDMIPAVEFPEFDSPDCSCRWLESPAMRVPDPYCHRHRLQWPDWQFPRSTMCRMDWSDLVENR